MYRVDSHHENGGVVQHPRVALKMAVNVLLFLIFSIVGLANGDSEVIKEGVVTITSSNWRELLTGEWMVEL